MHAPPTTGPTHCEPHPPHPMPPGKVEDRGACWESGGPRGMLGRQRPPLPRGKVEDPVHGGKARPPPVPPSAPWEGGGPWCPRAGRRPQCMPWCLRAGRGAACPLGSACWEDGRERASSSSSALCARLASTWSGRHGRSRRPRASGASHSASCLGTGTEGWGGAGDVGGVGTRRGSGARWGRLGMLSHAMGKVCMRLLVPTTFFVP